MASRKRKKSDGTSRWAAYFMVVIIGIAALGSGVVWALWQSGYRLGDLLSVKSPAPHKTLKTQDAKPATRKKTNQPGEKSISPKHTPVHSRNHKAAPRPKRTVKPPAPASTVKSPRPGSTPGTPAGDGPAVAIIIDDFGNTLKYVDDFIDMDVPITIAILPNLPYSGKISWRARQKGRQVILHLPLENTAGINPGPGTITTSMSREEVAKTFNQDLDSVPGVVGFNNHEGSKATSDERLMDQVMSLAEKNGLFFIDSYTSSKSVALKAAKVRGIDSGRRNVFLDNEDDVDYICGQLQKLAEKARKDGRAIGIGHCRKNTQTAIAKMAPKLREKGIRFIYVSEMIR